MKDTCYLVVSADGVEKMNLAQKPDLKSGQRGFLVEIEVPDRFFDQAFPKVSISVDESQLIEPEADVQVQESKAWMIEKIEDLLVSEVSDEEREALMDRLDQRMPYLGDAVATGDFDELSYSQLATILEEMQHFDL